MPLVPYGDRLPGGLVEGFSGIGYLFWSTPSVICPCFARLTQTLAPLYRLLNTKGTVVGNWGFAEITLVVIGVLVVASVVAGGVSLLTQRRQPPAVVRAHRVGVVRMVTSVAAALVAFAVAVLIHIANPRLESVPFLLGLLLAAAVGLGVFSVMPVPSIDGAMRRRTASVMPRRLSDYSTVRQRATFATIASMTALIALLSGLLSKPADDGRWICPVMFSDPCLAGGPFLFPGWLFAAPALPLIGLLVVAVRHALRRVVTSPATAWPELSETDTALRRGAVRLVLRVANASLLLTSTVFLGSAALPLMNAPVLETGMTPDSAQLAGIVGLVLLGVAGVVFLVGMVMAVLAATSLARLPRGAADVSTVMA